VSWRQSRKRHCGREYGDVLEYGVEAFLVDQLQLSHARRVEQ